MLSESSACLSSSLVQFDLTGRLFFGLGYTAGIPGRGRSITSLGTRWSISNPGERTCVSGGGHGCAVDVGVARGARAAVAAEFLRAARVVELLIGFDRSDRRKSRR